MAPASAAPIGNAAVTVRVLDAAGKPVWLAKVTIYGPRTLVGESIRSGDALFSQIPAGAYRIRVEHYGYTTADMPVTVPANGNLAFVVRLRSAIVKQIAHVAVRAQTGAVPPKVSADAPSAELGDSLISALQSLPGLTISPSGQASIDGYSPSQTLLTINGVPASIPGTPENLQLFNAAVFSEASITPQAGGGGTVDFQTQTPTLAWQGVARAVLSSYQGEDLALQELGSAGDVGVSFTHASHIVSNALAGRSFLDTSGLFYSHSAADSVAGNALQLRYEFSLENTLLATAVGLDSTLPMVCDKWTGAVPCGYGPTNLQRAGLHTYQLKDIARIHSNTVVATLYDNTYSNELDQSGYYVNGVHMPSTSLTNGHQTGVMLTTSLRMGRLSLPLNFSSASVNTHSFGSAFGPMLPPFISQYSSQAVSTTIPLVKHSRFSGSVNLAARRNAVAGMAITRANGSVNFGYRFSDYDALSATFSPNNLGGPTAGYNGVSPATLLQFICSESVGIGGGPSSARLAGSQTSTSINWNHAAPGYSFGLKAYHNVAFNAPINAIVGFSSLNPALFPATYLAEAQQAAQLQCGGTPLVSPQELYFNVVGIASRAVYEGAQISASYQPSKTVSVSGEYNTTFARAFGSDPLLFGPHSTVMSGHQLPNVAPHTADFTVKATLGSQTVGLIQARYSSSNNGFNLPAYVTLDSGVLVSMPRGMLSITITNIGNVRPGPFATADGAVALPMLQGAFPTIAQPLQPRTLNVGYRFHIGPPEETPSFSVPNEQFQPIFGGVSFFLPPVTGLPAHASDNSLQIDRQSMFCGPKDAPGARELLETERSYIDSIEKEKTGEHYPDVFPPVVDGAVQFNYRKNGDSYVVYASEAPYQTFDDFEHQVAPLLNCSKPSVGTDAQIQSRHLFQFGPALDDGSENMIVPLLPLFAPEVGLYHGPYRMMGHGDASGLPPPQNLPGGKWPSPPPNQPFAVMNWPGCPAEIRPAAQEFLDAIQRYAHAYFDLHQTPPSPDGLLITTHHNGTRAWISIRSEDLSSMQILSRRCMFVRRMSSSALDKLKLGAERRQLNYAPGIGLYEAL